MSDCEHTCYHCWLEEKKAALMGWLFRHMPLRWRHRRLMREAMKMRRHWREADRYRFLIDPRAAHQRRRLLRSITRSIGMMAFPKRIIWEDDKIGDECK